MDTVMLKDMVRGLGLGT